MGQHFILLSIQEYINDFNLESKKKKLHRNPLELRIMFEFNLFSV